MISAGLLAEERRSEQHMWKFRLVFTRLNPFPWAIEMLLSSCIRESYKVVSTVQYCY